MSQATAQQLQVTPEISDTDAKEYDYILLVRKLRNLPKALHASPNSTTMTASRSSNSTAIRRSMIT